MTTTRITAADGKQYDVTYTLNPAVMTPAVLQPAVLVPATMTPASFTVSSVVPVVVPAPTPVPAPAPGLITSFSGSNGARFQIDGVTVSAQNANHSWSLLNPDDHTLRFSVKSGDYWSTSGWSDITNDAGANRSEIQFSPTYAAGTQINVSERLTVQPGPISTASFVGLSQLHATTNSPPAPVSLQLEQNTDRLQVILQSPSNQWNRVYLAPKPVVRGQAMDLVFQMKMDPSGSGFVRVWLDGVQIVNFTGAVGATGSEYYWKVGVYRGSAAETLTADFSNLKITTG